MDYGRYSVSGTIADELGAKAREISVALFGADFLSSKNAPSADGAWNSAKAEN